MFTRWIFPVLLGAGLSACPDPGVEVANRTVTTACGRCVFQMEGVEGCPWAVQIDGEYYLTQGVVPHNHSTHAPDGICNMPREAEVAGAIRDGKFISRQFELKPARDVPTEPAYTPEDVH